MRRRGDADRENIPLTELERFRNIEDAANECTFDCSNRFSVQPNHGEIVDALKRQRKMATLPVGRCLEFCPIPVVLSVQALGNREVIQSVVGVGINTLIDHGRQDRAGNRRQATNPLLKTPLARWLHLVRAP